MSAAKFMRKTWVLGWAALVVLAGSRVASGQEEEGATAPPSPEIPAGNTFKTQVRVEARILEWQVTDDFSLGFGVDYFRTDGGGIVDDVSLLLPAEPSLGTAARIFFEDAGSDATFEGFIETLERHGTVKILSQPSIVLTESGVADAEDFNLNDPGAFNDSTAYEAKLTNSTRIPYEFAEALGVRLVSTTQYRDTGVTLDVSVVDVDGNLVVLDLKTTVQDLSGFVNIGLNERNEPTRVPMLEKRMVQNRLIIPDRQIQLAGLMKTTRKEHRRRSVPWLGEVPILEWFISSRNTSSDDTELVFLVKPEVITPYRQVESVTPDRVRRFRPVSEDRL